MKKAISAPPSSSNFGQLPGKRKQRLTAKINIIENDIEDDDDDQTSQVKTENDAKANEREIQRRQRKKPQ